MLLPQTRLYVITYLLALGVCPDNLVTPASVAIRRGQTSPDNLGKEPNIPSVEVTSSTELPRTGYAKMEYDYPLNKPDLCAGQTFLVIVVCSAFHHFTQREAIRKTWASFQYAGLSSGANLEDILKDGAGPIDQPFRKHAVHVVFLVGHQSGNQTFYKQSQLLSEDNQHHDIIQGDFMDTYANLTTKSVSMLNWMDKYCREARFLLKTDDDMLINVPMLVRDLARTVHTRFIMGNIIVAAQPIREKQSKWYTPTSLYNSTMYPKYISGAAYVMSGDIIHDLLSAAMETAPFWIEDVYITGLLAQRIKASHVFNGKFRYSQSYLHPCFLRLGIAAHRIDPPTLRTMWAAVKDEGLTCDYSIL